jgi:hypothetical protein
LKKYQEANTFDELKCFVGAIGSIFHTISVFATQHAQDISALRLYIVVSFERRGAASACRRVRRAARPPTACFS